MREVFEWKVSLLGPGVFLLGLAFWVGPLSAKEAEKELKRPKPYDEVFLPCAPYEGESYEKAANAISSEQAKVLLEEFEKAQRIQLKALEHRQGLEKKHLEVSQRARFQEWENKERKQRQEFYQKNADTRVRQDHQRDYESRRKTYQGFLEDELKQRDLDNQARIETLKNEQQEKLKEFKKYLQDGVRPPGRLWPSTGY